MSLYPIALPTLGCDLRMGCNQTIVNMITSRRSNQTGLSNRMWSKILTQHFVLFCHSHCWEPYWGILLGLLLLSPCWRQCILSSISVKKVWKTHIQMQFSIFNFITSGCYLLISWFATVLCSFLSKRTVSLPPSINMKDEQLQWIDQGVCFLWFIFSLILSHLLFCIMDQHKR